MSLYDLVRSSLEADYQRVEQLAPDAFAADNPREDRRHSRSVLVVVSDAPDGVPDAVVAEWVSQLPWWLDERAPEERFIVTASQAGIGRDDRIKLRDLAFVRQSPLMFFDRHYRNLTKNVTPVRLFVNEAGGLLAEERVPQRFTSRRGGPGGDDLLRRLVLDTSEAPERASLTLITGPAGAGKTIAFSAYFAWLYDQFQDHKRHMGPERFARPLLLVPDVIAGLRQYNLDRLLEAVFASDNAAPVSRDTLRWLLREGFAALMFDGMDEILSHQSDVFELLAADLCAPGSRARVVMGLRDGLLDTNEQVMSFLARLDRSGACAVREYRLAPWTPQDRRMLLVMRARRWLETVPRDEEFVQEVPPVGSEERVADQIEAQVAMMPTLAPLLTTPFYCELLASTWFACAQFDRPFPSDPLDLLDRCVEGILDRERAKLAYREHARAMGLDHAPDDPLVDFLTPEVEADVARWLASQPALPEPMWQRAHREQRDHVRVHALLRLVAAVAHENRRGTGEGTAVAVDTLSRLLDRQLGPAGDDVQRRLHALLALKQLALFRGSGGAGSVDFTHEILGDFLAGRHAAQLLSAAVEPRGLGHLPFTKVTLYPDDGVLSQVLGPPERTPTGTFEASVRWHLARLDPALQTEVRLRKWLATAPPSAGAAYLAEILSGG